MQERSQSSNRTNAEALRRVCRHPALCAFIESALGHSPASFPIDGIEVREAPPRSEKAGERLMIRRIGSGAIATGIPRVMASIAPLLETISLWELFSPFGIEELKRLLPLDVGENLAELYHYTLVNRDELQPSRSATAVRPLLPERYAPGPEERDAFAVYEGEVRASVVSVRAPLPGYVFLNVETRRDYRGRGYGAAAVSAAAQWILDRGDIAHYNVRLPNPNSIRLARRLGFILTSQVLLA